MILKIVLLLCSLVALSGARPGDSKQLGNMYLAMNGRKNLWESDDGSKSVDANAQFSHLFEKGLSSGGAGLSYNFPLASLTVQANKDANGKSILLGSNKDLWHDGTFTLNGNTHFIRNFDHKSNYIGGGLTLRNPEQSLSFQANRELEWKSNPGYDIGLIAKKHLYTDDQYNVRLDAVGKFNQHLGGSAGSKKSWFGGVELTLPL